MNRIVSDSPNAAVGGASGREIHTASEPRVACLTLDISLSPDYVGGTVRDEDGAATAFEGWLGLARAVARAAGGGSRRTAVSGPDLLGDWSQAAGRSAPDRMSGKGQPQ